MPFEPGKSGNPGGRPKVVHEVRELAQQHTTAAIERLVRAMNGNDDRIAIAAATALLDRAVGKPTQATELTGPEGQPIAPEMSDIELARRIAFILDAALRRQNVKGKIVPLGRCGDAA